ncbi:MAG: helix-turn-helix domain-containing protein [Gammaproteobacteria bacterium]|nr:helix-turn-helix domain-containing protein [Gammaproteobacteria bacterium]
MKKEPHDRLQEARKSAGYDNPTDAARAFGWTVSTYLAHENGSRGIRYDVAERYGKAFKVSAAWLLSGNEKLTTAEFLQFTEHKNYVEIKELDVTAGAGGGTLAESDGENAIGTWSIPESSVQGYLPDARGVRIIQVVGDSMVPEFVPGQRIFVNVSDRVPSPPGVFVVWDGFGLVIKRCMMIPHSDPPRVRLTSTNQEYPPYEVTVEEAYIQGRVIGKLQWT